MKLNNVIKRLSKYGEVKALCGGVSYVLEFDKFNIEITADDDEVCCISAKTKKETIFANPTICYFYTIKSVEAFIQGA